MELQKKLSNTNFYFIVVKSGNFGLRFPPEVYFNGNCWKLAYEVIFKSDDKGGGEICLKMMMYFYRDTYREHTI